MHLQWIYKACVGVIDLNYKPRMPDINFNCSLCNPNKVLDMFHFIAKFSILKKVQVLAGRIFFRETRFLVLFEWLGLANLRELFLKCVDSQMVVGK